MPKLCEYQNCRRRASYGVKRDCPIRCNIHKEEMKLCYSICRCGKYRPSYNLQGKIVAICCKDCKTDNMVNVISKKCRCGKSIPCYNLPGETRAICCSDCKTDVMIDVKHKKCRCGKSIPIYNLQGETRPDYCKDCKTDNMIDVIHKKCRCGKSRPIFNLSKENIPVCCKDCKTQDMIDILNKKCQCGKAQPSFNLLGETFPICCKDCKTDIMIDVKNKKCRCGKAQPSYNLLGETVPICCKDCKTDIMIDVISKKCRCGKAQPSFNLLGETFPICCKDCKSDDMVDVKSKKCICGKAQPSYNLLGETVPICCKDCKSNKMVDVKHKRCNGIITSDNITEECPYNNTANKKYKNYCTECFKRNFPIDPLTFQIKSKTKEIAVRDFINAHFEGFQHDKPLTTTHCDCTIRRRIDHRKLINNTLLVIETDENQHKSYDEMDEETRYDDLYMAFSGKWIYIRFNPDKYIENGKNKNPVLSRRLEELKIEINKQIERINKEKNTELVERIYMYYDN